MLAGDHDNHRERMAKLTNLTAAKDDDSPSGSVGQRQTEHITGFDIELCFDQTAFAVKNLLDGVATALV